jgi:hypothetical protein
MMSLATPAGIGTTTVTLRVGQSWANAWTNVVSAITAPRTTGRAIFMAISSKEQTNIDRTITLWTHSILTAARSIYARAGFKLIATKAHSEFGPRLVGETGELEL